MTEESMVWIKTEPSLDGSTYVVTVEVSADRAIILSPESAPRYAMTILAAVARAEYDAAVYRQMSAVMPDDKRAVGGLISDLRADRPDIDLSATAPLEIRPGVNKDAEPFLTVLIEDEPVGQWTIADANEHVLVALQVSAVADLDAGYYRVLTGIVGIEPDRARTIIDDLQHHRVDA
jgi:hypothetical protein